MHSFPDEVVAAVLRHMDDDHTGDSLVIVKANGAPDAVSGKLIAFDGDGGTWEVVTDGGVDTIRIPWSKAITERAEIRREIVELHRNAAGL